MNGKYRWDICINCGTRGKEKYRKDLGYILVCPKCDGLIDIDNKFESDNPCPPSMT